MHKFKNQTKEVVNISRVEFFRGSTLLETFSGFPLSSLRGDIFLHIQSFFSLVLSCTSAGDVTYEPADKLT